MSRKFDAVVFDLDGLMFNTEVVFHETGTELLRRRGKPAPPELFAAMMGRRAPDAFRVMIEMMELDDSVETLQPESWELFCTLLDKHLEPMPGLLDLLGQLEAAGVRKAVATSSGRDYAHDVLGRYQLIDRFGVILAAEDVSDGKPHPEIYQTATARLSVSPSQAIVLEDSNAGICSAKAAGCYAVAVPHEHSHGQSYEEADLVIDTLADPVLSNLLQL